MVVKVTRSFTAIARGIGKPDYTREVASAKERAGILVHYDEQLATFAVVLTDQVVHPTAIPWVQPPLAPGATSHLYNTSTGLVTPYTVPAGYTFALVQNEWASSEDVEMWVYYDGLLVVCPGITPPGANLGWNMVVMFSTVALDPTGASSHAIDIHIINAGAGNLEGSFDMVGLLTKVGSPDWPTTKQCRCPFCGHVQTVPVGITRITCEKCGEAYLVYDYSKVKNL